MSLISNQDMIRRATLGDQLRRHAQHQPKKLRLFFIVQMAHERKSRIWN